MSQIESNPISDLLSKLYLPGWTAAELSLAAPWGFQVPANQVCMYVVLQGSGWYQSDGTEEAPIRLIAGDHLITTRGVPHRVSRNLGDVAQPIESVLSEATWKVVSTEDSDATVMLYAHFQLNGLTRNPLGIGLPDIVHLNHRRDKELAYCLPILDLAQSTRGEAMGNWQFTIRKLAELVLINTLSVELERGATSATENGEFNLLQAVTDPSIGPVLKKLVDHPESPWTVPQMAGMAKVSKSAFSERFRNLVGFPPLQFLTEIRMQKASHLLSESNIEIANIASLVGYESPSSFSNAFKRWTGISPAEYRRKRD